MSYSPPPDVLERLTEANVEAALRALYVPRPGSALRPEELRKIPQVAGILPHLARTRRDPLLVDAAAGRAPAGLIAAHLLGWSRVVIIERDAGRTASARRAAARLKGAQVEVREGDISGSEIWPPDAEVVVALHACGPAFDAVLDQVAERNVPWLVAVPCCYSDAIGFAPTARAWAEALGVSSQAPVRRRFVESLIDTERTLRLEAAGYRVSVQAFVPPTVTPHNLAWRAQRVGPSRHAERARERRNRLVAGPVGVTIDGPLAIEVSAEL
jgi:hypothetical protein